MWLQVDQSLPDHRKTSAVADRLHIPEVHVVGHMVTLWLWCMDNAREGRLAGISNRTLAQKAQWSGDPDQFVNALIAAGFLDDDFDGLAIHNWATYTGKILDQRKAHARRQADYERRKADQLALALESDAPEADGPIDGFSAESLPSGDGQVTDTCRSTVHDMTRHDRREENRSMGSDEPEGERPPLREDQQMWVELARCLHIPRGTKWSAQAKGAWNRAIKELRALGAKPADIESLCLAYEARFGKPPPSPNALVSHYPECRAAPPPPRHDQYARSGYNGRGVNGNGGAAIARGNGRQTESIVVRLDDPPRSGGSALPNVPGLENLDRIPRSG